MYIQIFMENIYNENCYVELSKTRKEVYEEQDQYWKPPCETDSTIIRLSDLTFDFLINLLLYFTAFIISL